jgi:uncharacterized membrane protein
MRFKKVSAARIVLLTLLLFATVLPVFIAEADAQSSANYWVTVKPNTDSQMYTTVNRNWTLSFEALWSYGSSSGRPISNAKVTIQVSGVKEGAITALQLNTTSGVFSFNYSSSTADKITFTPTELKTQDGAEYNSTLVKSGGSQAYGFQSTPVTVWWDTFQVSLINYNTGALRAVAVSVNVTYLLLPQEGLTLPSRDTYSHQTFLPKIVSGANVTINGVKAQEASVAGIYSADVSTVFPTAYVLVTVAQNGWTTTHTAYDFTQKSNETVWSYALVIGLILVAVSVLLYFVLFRKPAQAASLLSRASFPLIGGVLLLFTSFVSLYWGALALEATSHGFNWLILAVAGLGSFAFGTAGSVMSLKKRNEALVIFAVCIPFVVNVVVVKYALDSYLLTIPWLSILASTAASIVSGILITNSDEQFSKHAPAP